MVKKLWSCKTGQCNWGIIENKGNNKKVYLIGDAVFNYKAKILDKLGNCVKIFEDKNLTINTTTFVQMFWIKIWKMLVW